MKISALLALASIGTSQLLLITAPQPAQAQLQDCEPSYPSMCIAIGASDLDCDDISARNFPVRGLDPHRFDSDADGVGCES